MSDEKVVMDDVGHTHRRPNNRRLVSRVEGNVVLVVEQMEVGTNRCSDQEEGWEDVGVVMEVEKRIGDGVYEVETGEQSFVRDKNDD